VVSHTSIRTLIPEANSYGVALVVVYTLASFSLAAELYQRWFSARRIRVLHVYCGALVVAILLGALVVDLSPLFSGSPTAFALAVPVGFVAGAVAGWWDREVVRIANRRVLRRPRRLLTGAPATEVAAARPRPCGAGFGTAFRRRSLGAHRDRSSFRPSFRSTEFGLGAVVAVAVCEELAYRGVLVRISFAAPSTGLVAVALVATVAFFALTHVWFGWTHVVAKLPLGALALVAVLVVGNVLPAVVAHVVFNLRIWNEMRAGVYVPATT
jgi:Type II CAAX prenyl endopeptidase Rce1-like